MIPKNTNDLEMKFLELERDPTQKNLDLLFLEIGQLLALDSKELIFSLSLATDKKKYIASAILRIAEFSSHLLWKENTDVRLRIINLLDDIYAGDIYKILKIDQSESNHKKIPIYQSIVVDTINNAIGIEKNIVSLETAQKIRSAYMKFLKNPITKIFIDHHIYDKSLTSDERLAEFFSAIEQYSQAIRLKKLATYYRLKEIYSSYEDGIRKHQTSDLFDNIVKNIIIKIFTFVEYDFQSSSLQTPAKIEIVASKRKYPLHTHGQNFNIKLTLKNHGPGVAYETKVVIHDSDDSLKICTDEIYLGDIDVGDYQILIDTEAKTKSIGSPNIMGTVHWNDYKGDLNNIEFITEITPQIFDIDWNKVKKIQPYSLESIEKEEELIGRSDFLETISEKLFLEKMESSIIYGQKRVGKTSLAKTIKSRFTGNENYISIYIETGSLDKSSPEKFIKSMGEKIIERIKTQSKLKNIPSDPFDGSLYPLVSFIENATSIVADLKILLIVDEFDELPPQLYPYTNSGDSFFHSLRSISGESGAGRVALILVGGENMGVIMQTTDKLNKFDSYNVGYFDKSKSWEQFKELVETPLKDVMEYSDEAIISLYEITEGNPFYTKFIAKNLFKKMISNHCTYVSKDEMLSAIHDTIQNMEAINVNHFWSDCIRAESPEKRDKIETYRRRFLIAFAEVKRSNEEITREKILATPSLRDISVIDIYDSFLNRNIIVEHDGKIHLKPKLIETWLVEKGIYSLRSSFSDADALKTATALDDENYITDQEILELLKTWESYRGIQPVLANIRIWLNQFENNNERKIAFKILKNLRFYGERLIREKIKIVHELVRRNTVHSHTQLERVRKDIIVSCFGGPSKSGSSLTRIYAAENKITTHNIKSKSELKKALDLEINIKSVVFIEDILATGDSLIEELDIINKEYGAIFKEKNILVIIGFLCGMSDGIEKAIAFSKNLEFKVEIEICDVLTESDRAFSEDGGIFSDKQELADAVAICRKHGARLQKMHPLGFNDSQLLVVFKDNCPNNTLPILWESSNNPKWEPLFKRG